MIHVAGDVFAIAYDGDGVADGSIATITINSDGDIAASGFAPLAYDTESDDPSIVHVAGDVFAVAYAGDDTMGPSQALHSVREGSERS